LSRLTWKTGSQLVGLDEIQSQPDLSPILRVPAEFLLPGSASPDLIGGVAGFSSPELDSNAPS
jgi:hypothetical protein